ncbi:MFS transporter [Sphingomonas oleivorans]|uniref:MFS transporter n=1 Tax=Sphingomonas oleivorans TaxID=1735121 RepID=UPI001FAEEECD|nr:MFS transporter [Sphingomonas oleivorans]
MAALSLDASAENDALSSVYRRITIRLIPLLALCYFAAYLDRINVGFAKLTMLADLRLTEADFGLGAGLFFLGYVLFETPSNLLLAKIGARVWIARIMVTWGLLSALCMVATTAPQFHVLRFLLGVAEAGFLPGVLFYLSCWFPSHRRGRIFSLFLLGLPLSGVVGAPLSGWIMRHLDAQWALAGWQWLFLLEALPSIILGILVFVLLPASPDQAKWLTSGEKQLLREALAADEPAGAASHFAAGLRDWRIWLLGGVDFAILLTTYALGFWLPTLIKGAGVADPLMIGLYASVPNFMTLIAMILISRSSDRHRERRLHIMIPFAIGATAMALLPFFPHSLSGSLILLSVASAMVTGVVPVYFSIPATFLRGPAAAAGFALACSLANIAGLVSNSLIGFAVSSTGSAGSALWLFSAFLVIGIFLVKQLPPQLVNR